MSNKIRPLFSDNTGTNLVDDQKYELVNGMEPLPSTWFYNDYDPIQKGGGYLYPGLTWKINFELMTNILSNFKVSNKNLLNKLYNCSCDYFVKFEELNNKYKWISTHALCYYLYAKKNNLPCEIVENFDKIFTVKMGIYPLDNTVIESTIPVNTTEYRIVEINRMGDDITLGPPDQNFFMFDKIKDSDTYVTIVDSILVEKEELLNNPIIMLHNIDKSLEGNNIKYIIKYFIKYLKYKQKYLSLKKDL
ncbi:hypothetical protein Catovirus_1_930 [Catovirus CTV1]|uniref:Uncharacterized protein n=1 Tax=Catovirus CTV1 TaxID=1977631 RepID=A0A1V0SAX7_9VIRU|nr:hypothetical protein Catovirus_1_930 [Catovirus CTV1]